LPPSKGEWAATSPKSPFEGGQGGCMIMDNGKCSALSRSNMIFLRYSSDMFLPGIFYSRITQYPNAGLSQIAEEFV
jgi:hypothetical protein